MFLCEYLFIYLDIIISFQIWIYFATILKTTAPVKLTISHLFL